MLNSIGLQNPGVDLFLEQNLPRLAALGVPIWVSVGGFSAADFAHMCERLDEYDDVATIELNLSCPNVEEAPETAAQLVSAARAATQQAAVREALARDVGRRRVRSRRRGRGCRRSLADQHDPRSCRRQDVVPPEARSAVREGTRGRRSSPSRSRASTRARRRSSCRSWAWVASPRVKTSSISCRSEQAPSRSEPSSSRTRLRPVASGRNSRPSKSRRDGRCTGSGANRPPP